MAVTINLTDLANLQNDTTATAAINSNSTAIETAFQNVLALDGTSPNQMQASLDMNSNRILNLPRPISDNEPARSIDIGNAPVYGAEAQAAQAAAAISATAAAASSTSASGSATSATASASSASTSATASAASAAAAAASAGSLSGMANHGIPVANSSTTINASIAPIVGGVLASTSASLNPSFTSAPSLGASGTLGSLTMGNATSGTVTVQPVTGALGSVTVSLPAATDTLVGKATTDTLTNKTYDTAGTGNTFKINGTTISANTGTGSNVLATSPTLVTPALGTPASGVATNLTGTASGLTAGTVTTNANLTGPITSSGNATSVGAQTGTGSTFVMNTSPTLVTPNIGVATATSVNKMLITAPASGSTLAVADGKVATISNTLTFSGTDASALAIGVGGTITGSSSSAIFYDNIPQNSKSAAYTTVLADAQKHIFHPSADTTARVWTIDSNANVAYPIGTMITFVNQNSGGVITIAITSDTLRLAGSGTTGSRSLAANGIATALKVASTEWIISGTGLT